MARINVDFADKIEPRRTRYSAALPSIPTERAVQLLPIAGGCGPTPAASGHNGTAPWRSGASLRSADPPTPKPYRRPTGGELRSIPESLAKLIVAARDELDRLYQVAQQGSPQPARGGLSAHVLRRVREYIELHLDATISLETLADIAGLSMYHFARAFKQSLGVTPHGYLIRRRIERAQELLTDSALSLSEVALAAGFSDQSHLARHFRQRLGLSPSAFRMSNFSGHG